MVNNPGDQTPNFSVSTPGQEGEGLRAQVAAARDAQAAAEAASEALRAELAALTRHVEARLRVLSWQFAGRMVGSGSGPAPAPKLPAGQPDASLLAKVPGKNGREGVYRCIGAHSCLLVPGYNKRCLEQSLCQHDTTPGSSLESFAPPFVRPRRSSSWKGPPWLPRCRTMQPSCAAGVARVIEIGRQARGMLNAAARYAHHVQQSDPVLATSHALPPKLHELPLTA